RILASEGKARALLRGIAAGSPFLWGLCAADTGRLASLLDEDPQSALERILTEALAEVDAAPLLSDAMTALRRMKQAAALLVGLADLSAVWDVEQVTEALSMAADRAVSGALRWLLREAGRAGQISLVDGENPERGCGLAVIAMGKHGAGELNYSSDIDLIVL